MSELTPLGHKVKKTRKAKPAVWKTAMSLKPGQSLMDLLLLPHPTERCLAIRDAWAFNAKDDQGNRPHAVTRPPVVVVSDPQVIFAPEQESFPFRTSRAWRAQYAQALADMDLG